MVVGLLMMTGSDTDTSTLTAHLKPSTALSCSQVTLWLQRALVTSHLQAHLATQHRILYFVSLLCFAMLALQSAQREIALWFKAEELADYTPTTCAWVYE